MCGIAGILSNKEMTVEVLQDISKVLQHRGPDDEGYATADDKEFLDFKGDDTIQDLATFPHINEKQQFNVGLVHRRLSIIDLEKEGHQPMLDTSQNYMIVFNGEVYNYKELRIELEQDGATFNSVSDTEIVLQAYIKWGKDCVHKFVGMWAFSIYDIRNQQLFISRDRFGIKPFYYFNSDEYFAFASEIKGLLKIPGIEPIADKKLVSEYVMYGTISQPYQNLFKDIEELHPGHNGSYNFATGEFKVNQYYSLEEEVKKRKVSRSFDHALDEYKNIFTDAVHLHLRSDVPVGSCLSGGLDSSALVGEIAPEIGTTFNTFTASYEDKQIDESDFAKEAIKDFKNVKDHYTYPSADVFHKDIAKIVYFHDQPVGSASMYAHWEVMKLASEHKMKVLLNGQGADESLGGYGNFAGVYLLGLVKNFRFLKFLKEKKRVESNFTKGAYSKIASAIYYHLPSSLKSSLRKKERIGHQFLNKEILENLKIDVPVRGGKRFRENSFSAFRYGLYDLLRNEDRNSMAFSIESRVPYLDHRLVEYSIALPTKFKIKKGWSKYVLRKGVESKISDKIVWRKYKMGFLTPQRKWKNELNQELMEELKDLDFPKMIDKEAFLKFCKTDIKSDAHLSEFWRMYSLLKWKEVFDVKF